MKLIALLLASVSAIKTNLSASTKSKSKQFGDLSSLFGDLDMQSYADAGFISDADLSEYNNAMADFDTAMNDLNNLEYNFDQYDWDTAATSGAYWDDSTCVDTDNGAVNDWNEDCEDYENNPSWCGSWDGNGFVSNAMCCICGGGETQMFDAWWEEPEQEPEQECFWWNEQEWQGVSPEYPAWTVCGLDDCVPCAPETDASEDTCVNTDNGAVNDWNEDCGDYEANPHWCGSWDGNGFVSNDMCCVCGGGYETVADEHDATAALVTPDAPEQADGTAECVNSDAGFFNNYGENCIDYEQNQDWCGFWDGNGFESESMCCVCGGGDWSTGTEAGSGDDCEANEYTAFDKWGDSCADYAEHPDWCGVESWYTEYFDSMRDCCACQE